jgi:hypothetical protein
MENNMTTYPQGEISTSPAVVVSAGTTRADAAPLTSGDNLIDASAGPASGVIMPTIIQGPLERQNVRISSLGPAAVNIYKDSPSDPDLPISVLPAFSCFDFWPGGGGTYAVIRIWE